MITFVLGGTSRVMPLQMVWHLGHSIGDRETARAILLHNGWLWRLNPMMALYLKGI